MSKVAVSIWNMGSDPGYVSSSGKQWVELIPQEVVADLIESGGELYDFDGERVNIDCIYEKEPIFWRSGVCNYDGYSGVIDVPDGMIAVHKCYEDISTRNGVYYSARALNNEESLLDLYKRREEKYRNLVGKITNEIGEKNE